MLEFLGGNPGEISVKEKVNRRGDLQQLDRLVHQMLRLLHYQNQRFAREKPRAAPLIQPGG